VHAVEIGRVATRPFRHPRERGDPEKSINYASKISRKIRIATGLDTIHRDFTKKNRAKARFNKLFFLFLS